MKLLFEVCHGVSCVVNLDATYRYSRQKNNTESLKNIFFLKISCICQKEFVTLRLDLYTNSTCGI